jgi:exostosin family protein
MKLTIFSDRGYLPEGRQHVTMPYPFWGKNPEDPGDPSSGRYDRYAEVGSRLFEMATLEKADVAVFPEDWSHVVGHVAAMARAEQFLERTRKAKKVTVIFFWNDSDEAIPYDRTAVLRTSLYCSCKKANEFAMPAWSEDFVAKYLGGQLPVRSKHARPVVGFCGYAPSILTPNGMSGAIRKWKNFLTKLGRQKKADSSIRNEALQALSSNPWVHPKIVIREHFFGHAFLPSGELDYVKLQRLRQEYVQNIVESDYILCARGGGNFSYRLYETLSCGRIPVFVDTDCVLPYDSEIKWKDYCVWVDETEVEKTGEKVAEFHASLSDRQFVELQRECRRLWESHLSPEGFFANLYKHFR